jgi:hypothetical protein
VFRPTQDTNRAIENLNYRSFTFYATLFQVFHLSSLVSRYGPTTPNASIGFVLIPVRSPLLWESHLISLPLATEMFHFTRFAPRRVTYISICWVAPFGNPRIKALWQLPEAYRSLIRPSSPLPAKASTYGP